MGIVAQIGIVDFVARIAITDFITWTAIADFITRIATSGGKQVFQPFAKCKLFAAGIVAIDFVARIAGGFVARRTGYDSITRTTFACRIGSAVNKFFET
jgi:hypothetical protein